MKGPLHEAQFWGVDRDGRSRALVWRSIHIVAVVIERQPGDVIGCGGEAGRVVDGMLGRLRVGASKHAAGHGLRKGKTWRRGVNGQASAESESELLQYRCLRLRHRAARNSATWTVRRGRVGAFRMRRAAAIARAADAAYHSRPSPLSSCSHAQSHVSASLHSSLLFPFYLKVVDPKNFAQSENKDPERAEAKAKAVRCHNRPTALQPRHHQKDRTIILLP
jgi:hypothetical protein